MLRNILFNMFLYWFDTSKLIRLSLLFFSGLITILAMPHENAFSFMAWFCMVGWIISLHRAGWFERIVYGFLFGIIYIVPGQCSSIWHAIQIKEWSVYLSAFSIFLFFICYVIPFIIFSIVFPYIQNNGVHTILRQSIWLTVFIAWFPVYFPVYPALMIHDQPIFLQIMDIGGMAAVNFVLIFVNFSIVRLVFQIRNIKDIVQTILMTAALLISVILYGHIRLHQLESQKVSGIGNWINIAAVQTRVHPFESVTSLVRENSTQRFSAFEWTRYVLQQNQNVDLVLFPEASIDFTQKNQSSIMIDKISDFAIRYCTPILFSYTESIEDTTSEYLYNHAQLILSDGIKGSSYQKRILTPFYEYNPLQNLFSLNTPSFKPGSAYVLMETGNTKIIPAICYEIHSVKHMREFINLGGNCIAHLSNFYSFGGGVIAFFDLTMAKLYAVQYRVPIVRATNYGYGAFIDCTGILLPNSLNQPGNRTAQSFSVFIPSVKSFYASFGDIFLFILTVIWMQNILELLIKWYLNFRFYNVSIGDL